MGGAASEGELDVAGPAEGAVDRVVDVDADPAVEVLGRVGDPVGPVGPTIGTAYTPVAVRRGHDHSTHRGDDVRLELRADLGDGR